MSNPSYNFTSEEDNGQGTVNILLVVCGHRECPSI
jgi:hypothetical protein